MHRRLFSVLAPCAIVAAALMACSPGGTGASSPSATPTSTVGPAVQKYEGLVNGYWDDYVRVATPAVGVCLGTGAGTQGVNPSACGQHAAAILPVQEKFLSDLGASSAPAEFAGEDQVFRAQLPKAIVDLRAMISSGSSGDQQATQRASNAFVDDMGPVLTALDTINPAVQHG
jgi:hypothetical protein